MTKRKKLILFILLFVIIFMIIFIAISFRTNITNSEINNATDERLDKLKKILKDSTYFDNSKFKYDYENLRLTLDDKYDISIKSGTYMMNIKDERSEEFYCKIVDAIEMSFGTDKGEAIETCKETLDGAINLGGISVEFFDNYKVLTVNMNEKATLYSTNSTHVAEELISIDEINYDIKLDNYMFTMMSTNYKEETHELNICGNVFNKRKKTCNFVFTIYDENKEEIKTSDYKYENDTGKYISFCTVFQDETNSAKFYSLKFAN